MLDVGCWLGAGGRSTVSMLIILALGGAFGRSTGAVLTKPTRRRSSSWRAFLAGVFGGAFEANFVAVEVGQDAFGAGVHPVDEGEAGVVVVLEILPASTVELFVF